jgi:multiple sugar transport system substrate-binding protein
VSNRTWDEEANVSASLDRRAFLRWGTALAATTALAACSRRLGVDQAGVDDAFSSSGSYDGPPVELTFWNGWTGGEGPVALDLIDQFHKDHSNVTVTMVLVPWDPYYQKVPGAVASGRGPDLGIMHIDHLATNAAHGVIVPLDAMTDDLGLRGEDFVADAWTGGEWEGKRYGIPLDVHPLGFYANLDVMKQAGLSENEIPQTKEQLLSALDALKDKGIQGNWVSPFLFTGVFMFQSLLYQYGGELVDEDGQRATFANDAGVEALGFMQDLVEKGYSPRNVGQDGDAVAFMNGDNCFEWNGCWAIGQYDTTPGLKWSVAPVPVIGEQQGVWGNSHQFVVMNRDGFDPNKLAAAKTFVGWMIQHSAAWGVTGDVPAYTPARNDPSYTKLEAQQAFAAEVGDVKFPPQIPGVTDGNDAINTAVNAAVLLRSSAKDALSSAASVVDAVLADNRERYAAAVGSAA